MTSLGRLVTAVVSSVLVLGLTANAVPFREEAVSVGIPQGSLAGTLTIPAGDHRVPVALIIAGSGPTDRDGNSPIGVKTDAYKLLAHELAAHGIATLRYDKRGIGESAIFMREADARFDDYVDDALALTKRLEGDSRFSRVVIIGHSEGSLIGMLAAQHDDNIAAFVALEGAGRKLSDLIEEQVRSSGAAAAIVDEVVTGDKLLLAGKPIPSPDPQLAALFRPTVQPFLISEYRYDPANEIAKLKIPVAIVQGTTDIQVNFTDAKRLHEANPKAKLVVIAGMNHVLRDAPVDRLKNIATYNEPSLPLHAELVPFISAFIGPS